MRRAPSVKIVGLEGWSHKRLVDAWRELAEYANERHWYRLDDWPRALFAYRGVLLEEAARRGEQLRLF